MDDDNPNIIFLNRNSELLNQKMDNKWKEYIKTIDYRVNTMWNFIIYNQFCNDEIKNLTIKNNNLTKHLEYVYKDIEILKNKNKQLKYIIDENKNSRKRPREKTLEETLSKDILWFNEIKNKKPRTYNYIENEERDKLLLNIFKNLNCIKDIINLENTEYLYDYLNLPKFETIFKMIPSLKELDKLIGMKSIKDQVFKMICYFVHQLNNKEELNHLVITGPPGVGKTTLAKILGDIYRNIGFLKNDIFIKARRSDLIAEYLGQTAVKTQKIIDSAEGGVLFIDEVYSLGNKEKRDIFTKECIDTINLNLTEKSDKLLVIIAGYKDEINTCFFSYNPGLERRFPLRFNIESYTFDELFEILDKFIIEEKWDITCKDKIKKLIKDNYECFKFMGGDMMTLFKYAKENYSLRIMKTDLYLESNKKLNINDFKIAVDRFKEQRIKKIKPLPSMYI